MKKRFGSFWVNFSFVFQIPFEIHMNFFKNIFHHYIGKDNEEIYVQNQSY